MTHFTKANLQLLIINNLSPVGTVSVGVAVVAVVSIAVVVAVGVGVAVVSVESIGISLGLGLGISGPLAVVVAVVSIGVAVVSVVGIAKAVGVGVAVVSVVGIGISLGGSLGLGIGGPLAVVVAVVGVGVAVVSVVETVVPVAVGQGVAVVAVVGISVSLGSGLGVSLSSNSCEQAQGGNGLKLNRIYRPAQFPIQSFFSRKLDLCFTYNGLHVDVIKLEELAGLRRRGGVTIFIVAPGRASVRPRHDQQHYSSYSTPPTPFYKRAAYNSRPPQHSRRAAAWCHGEISTEVAQSTSRS